MIIRRYATSAARNGQSRQPVPARECRSRQASRRVPWLVTVVTFPGLCDSKARKNAIWRFPGSCECRQVDATPPPGSCDSASWIMRQHGGGMAAAKPTPPERPMDVSEAGWSEAVRREVLVRALAAAGVNSRSVIHAAAADLGLSRSPGLSAGRAISPASGYSIARRPQARPQEGGAFVARRSRTTDRGGH